MQQKITKDLSEVGLFRAALGIYFLFYYLSFFNNFDDYFGPHSMIDPTLLPELCMSFLIYMWDPFLLKIAYCAVLIGFLCFTLGLMNRLFLAMVFLLHISFHNINPLLVHEAQPLANLLLFFFFFIPIQVPPSLRYSQKNVNLLKSRDTQSIVIILVMFFGIYYFIAGIKKIPDPLWREGTAVYHLMNWSVFGKDNVLSQWLLSVPVLCKLFNYAVILFELSFIFLVFTQYRMYLIIVGVLLHIFNVMLLEVGSLSFIMMAWYALLLNGETRSHLGKISRVRPYLKGTR